MSAIVEAVHLSNDHDCEAPRAAISEAGAFVHVALPPLAPWPRSAGTVLEVRLDQIRCKVKVQLSSVQFSSLPL